MSYADKFKVFGPYSRKDSRQIVIVVDNNGRRRTVSYPKWILEVQLGRRLDPDLETVDHIDSNFLNNDLNNLRMVPRHEHSADDTRRVQLIKFECAWCGNEFERSPRLIRDKAKKNKAGPFCSRKCAGKYSRKLQLKLIDKFDVQQAVDSVYYKRKYAADSSMIILSQDELIDYICDIWEDDSLIVEAKNKDSLPLEVQKEELKDKLKSHRKLHRSSDKLKRQVDKLEEIVDRYNEENK